MPTVTNVKMRKPRPAPNRASASAAARTSASICIGPPAASLSASGAARQSIVWPLATRPWRSTSSGTPRPSPTTVRNAAPALRRNRSAKPATSVKTASGPLCAQVESTSRSATVPSGKRTSPPAILVPPTSMPMAQAGAVTSTLPPAVSCGGESRGRGGVEIELLLSPCRRSHDAGHSGPSGPTTA